jgi:hypothetical protein
MRGDSCDVQLRHLGACAVYGCWDLHFLENYVAMHKLPA